MSPIACAPIRPMGRALPAPSASASARRKNKEGRRGVCNSSRGFSQDFARQSRHLGDRRLDVGGTNDAESIATIRAAVERGVNLIDTAPAYGFGRSEEIVGRAIAESRLRSRVVIATKVGLEWRDEKVFRNASRDRILREAADSLRRLRTDYIDVYQVHWPDPLVPIEETAEAMQTLFDQGKIRAIGVSNFSVEQIDRFRRVAKLHVVQPPYNLFEREIEAELLPYCRQSDLATLTYGALCRGLLSGKLQEDVQFHGDDLRLTDPKFGLPRYAEYLAAVRRLEQFASDHYGK